MCRMGFCFINLIMFMTMRATFEGILLEGISHRLEKTMCKFQRDDLRLTISRCRALDASKELRDFVFLLTELNMRDMYEQSDWGWNASQKKKELSDKTSQYLIVKDDLNNDAVVGFVHFRFDIDFDRAVLYCYEIQLVKAVQRRGIGAHLMDILYKLAERFKMKKVILTVFKHNLQALNFYTKKLNFRRDTTDPKENHIDYTILSKKVEKD
ncbi:N-alpha-acetyltransferase 40-like isoform X2 [Varroa jacobsoni]|uniref:N-alpha-acetyltransferase 40 n=1 Tax=Varroa destructor TaxID=109461 RepID=A0A7M7JPB9_VARDE|nr:N-alpha-acetyltransferase 40-like isoform X2 [Varroa destructor]XP_022705302.1 N-alpha-acetyltransferase 40-like isoform X2 [Varroa jacobsoni]